MPEFDASNMELSEEEQARLLEEYEQEIKEREKAIASGQMDPVDEALLIQSDIEKTPQKTPVAKAATKAAKGSPSSAATTKKSSSTNQQQPQSASNKTANQKSSAQQKGGNLATKNAGSRTGTTATAATNSKQKTPAKKQQPQNELKIEKNHFTKDDVSSSNSDESWEKEFDLEWGGWSAVSFGIL